MSSTLNGALLGTRTALTRIDSTDQEYGTSVTFIQADPGSGQVTHTLLMTVADWNALGNPDTVTVMITPGDQLNPDL